MSKRVVVWSHPDFTGPKNDAGYINVDAASKAIKDALTASGIAFTEYRLDKDAMRQSVTYGGKPFAAIEVTGNINYALFPPDADSSYDNAALVAALAAAPTSVILPTGTAVPTKSKVQTDTDVFLRRNLSGVADLESIARMCQIILKGMRDGGLI